MTKRSASSLRQNQRTYPRKDRSASTDISDNDDTTYNRHHHQHRHQHRQQHHQQEHQHHQHHHHGQRQQRKDSSTGTDRRVKRSTSPPSRTQRTHRRDDRSPPSNSSDDNDSSDINRRRQKKHHPKRNSDPSPSDSTGKFDGSSSSDVPTDRLKARKHHRLKLQTFDRLTSWESWWAHFQNCASYNCWTERDSLAFMKGALTGNAAPVLWDTDKKLRTL